MKILKIDPRRMAGRGPEMRAEFIVQVTPDIRMSGLRLMYSPTIGWQMHYPKTSGGGHAVTVSPALRAQIIDLAVKAYEGLSIAENSEIRSAA